ncbi:MAG: GEVED domain-containing protein [Chitinophagales bacterium]|nr:GEVED domain-containing protein [Chitinophagales bacterium]
MTKYVRLLTLLTLLFTIQQLIAQLVTIPPTNPSGTGNTIVGRRPYGCFFGFERGAAIYTAAEIGTFGTITDIGFFVNSVSSPAAVTPVKLYLKETSATSFTASTYASVVAGATLVFDGTVTNTELVVNQWITKTLQTPFFYSGSQNLMVIFETNFGGVGGEGSTAKQFRYSTAATNSFQYWQSDNSPPTTNGVLASVRTNIQLNIVPASSCSGTPNPGSISAPSSVCPGTPFTLTLSGYTIGSGITFQWQQSNDGITFVNKPFNSTFPSTTDTISAPRYYRVIVRCGSDSAITSSVLVGINPFTACYCPSNATSTSDTKIDSVFFNTIITGSPLTTCQTYTDYTSLSTDIQRGLTYPIRIVNGFCGTTHYAAHVAVFIDWNQNGLFTDPGETVYTFGTTTGRNTVPIGNITVPVNAALGNTRMRVILRESTAPSPCGTYTYGETEDYTVNIIPSLPCLDPPAAGSISTANNKVCFGASATITASGFDTGANLQWQSSSDSIQWTDIPGQNSSVLISPPINSTTYFRLKVICVDSTFTNAVKVENRICYCNSGATFTGDTKIDSVFLNTLVAGSPLTSCETYTDRTNLSTNLQRLVSYPITIKNGFCGSTHYAASVAVYIDWNQDGDFADPDETVYTFGTTTGRATIPIGYVDVPGTALLGPTTMRVVLREGTGVPPACGTYSYGETEDYTVIVTPEPPCNNPPVGGIISGPDTAEANTVGIFVLTGYNGDNFSWEISNSPNGPFNPLGVDNDTLALFLNAVGTFYGRVKVTSPGCPPAYSDTFSIYVFLRGDDPCDAITVQIGQNGPFEIGLHTASPNEVRPPAGTCTAQGNWCNRSLTKSAWFKFQAPASGRVYIYTPGFDTQLALWEADSCASLADSTLGNYRLLGANDDNPNYLAFGVRQFSSFIDTVECLVPGKFYYIQVDPWSTSPTFRDTTSLFIIEAPAKDASFTGLSQDVYCENATAETLFPATPGGVFSGPGLQNNNEFNPSLAGVGGPYVISYTLNNCYTFRDTVSVSAVPDIGNVVINNVSCFGLQNGSIAVIMNAGTPPFTFQWSNNTSDSIASNLAPGQYQATITSVHGCEIVTTQFTITQPASPLDATANGINAKCFGTASGIAFASAQGGTPPYSYLWNNGATSDTIKDLAAATYTVIVSDSNSCKDTVVVNIGQPAPINITITKQNVTCHNGNNGSITANVTGGTGAYTYNWSNGASNTSNTITQLNADVYSLTVTDANGCIATISDTILQPPAIQISSSKTNVACFGGSTGSINITVSGGTPQYTYLWSNNATTQNVSGLTAGVYTVTVRDANGCTATKNDTIRQPSAPLSATSTSTDQIGNTSGSITVTVSGGTPGYQYNWSNGATTKDITANAGIYTVTITDANNCTVVLRDTINFISGTIEISDAGLVIKAYPNPVSEVLHVMVDTKETSEVTLEMSDALGRLILRDEKPANSQEIIRLNVAMLPAGLYSLKINVGNKSASQLISIYR